MTAFVPSLGNPPLQAIVWRDSGDPWRVAVVCMLLNATSRRQVDAVWPALFDRYPTALRLAADTRGDLPRLIRRLGLGAQRADRLRQMSGAWYVGNDRQRSKTCPVDVTVYPGLGRYAQDSHDLFVRGMVRDVAWRPTDRVVKAWTVVVQAHGLALCPSCRRWSPARVPMSDAVPACVLCHPRK